LNSGTYFSTGSPGLNRLSSIIIMAATPRIGLVDEAICGTADGNSVTGSVAESGAGSVVESGAASAQAASSRHDSKSVISFFTAFSVFLGPPVRVIAGGSDGSPYAST